MKTILLVVGLAFGWRYAAAAAPLDRSTFTEVIRDVNVLPATSDTATPAHLNDVLKAPDRVRTGPSSRAQLTAPDQTITLVGANTIFSFQGGSRTLNLEQGSLLFHSPKGIGGGMIKSGGAAAAVLGTTLIVVATPNGGFKVLFLEGRGTVTLANGHSVTLSAGQLVYVPPGAQNFSPVFYFNLAQLAASSQLVNGFTEPLSSLPLIQQAVGDQHDALTFGNLSSPGVPVDVYLFVPGGPGATTDPTLRHTGVTVGNPPPPGSLFPNTPQMPPRPPILIP